MKKNMILTGAFVAMMWLFGMSNVNAQDFVEVADFCNLSEYNRKPNHAYGSGTGKSIDREISRERAHSSALIRLSESLRTELTGYIRDLNSSKYALNRELGQEDIQKETGKVVERLVVLYASNINVVCEKTIGYKNENGQIAEYESFELVEFDKTEIAKKVLAVMKKEQMLKANANLDELERRYRNAFENR